MNMTTGGVMGFDTNVYITGNQSITLSGDVSGTGTTAITTAIGNNKVTGAMIALGSDEQGDVMYYNGTDWVALHHGNAGEVLQTGGNAANPSWLAITNHAAVTISDTATIDLSLSTQQLSADVVANSIGDTQLAYDTGQNLTTTSTPTFQTLTLGYNTVSGSLTLFSEQATDRTATLGPNTAMTSNARPMLSR